jgi:hypothetical protein
VATKLVGKYERKRAIEHAVEILQHQSNRIFEKTTELDDVVRQAADPDKIFGAAKDLSDLLVEMQRLVQVWRILRDDLFNNPEADEGEVANPDTPFAYTVPEPDAKAETTAAAADIPDCDMPF